MVAWFREAFPDAAFIDPPTAYTISHFAVRESLERLTTMTAGLRIIGVVREPFEMLVSLYEYWRTYPYTSPPKPPLIVAARERSFREFLSLAVGTHPVRTYRDFFDVGGPAWPGTRLLAFESLEPALTRVCQEFGVRTPEQSLARCNVGPRPERDISSYRVEAGSLVAAVYRHFAWYYDEGVRVMVRG
jgi:hypothetical protein